MLGANVPWHAPAQALDGMKTRGSPPDRETLSKPLAPTVAQRAAGGGGGGGGPSWWKHHLGQQQQHLSSSDRL